MQQAPRRLGGTSIRVRRWLRSFGLPRLVDQRHELSEKLGLCHNRTVERSCLALRPITQQPEEGELEARKPFLIDRLARLECVDRVGGISRAE